MSDPWLPMLVLPDDSSLIAQRRQDFFDYRMDQLGLSSVERLAFCLIELNSLYRNQYDAPTDDNLTLLLYHSLPIATVLVWRTDSNHCLVIFQSVPYQSIPPGP